MAHENNWQETGLCRIYTGTVSGEEIFESNLAIHGDPRFDDARYVINDFTRMTAFEILEEDVQKIAIVDNVASISNPKVKIAIVSTDKSFLEWANRYCEAMQGSLYQCKIFSNIDDADKWVK